MNKKSLMNSTRNNIKTQQFDNLFILFASKPNTKCT